MSEINPLVTAEAVKDALRSEDVRGALKQKVRQTFEAQIEAEVDAILDTLLARRTARAGTATGRYHLRKRRYSAGITGG